MSVSAFRGIERILLGRDPREAWAFSQRFGGVCTTVLTLASVRAVEDALDLELPLHAQYIRNLILIAHTLHDHVVHSYQLSALDWVDVTEVLKADPKKASSIAESLSDWTDNSEKQMAAVKQRVAGLVGPDISNAQLGPFAHGYWGHPAMKLPPEINLIAVSHYLQALEYQRYSNQVVAMLGGKTPHIQNVAVGGVSNAINLESEAALNVDRLFQMKSLLETIVSFVQNVYVPDVCAIAGFYPDWFSYGAGVTNYLSVPDLPLDGMNTQFELPGGFIPNGDLSKLVPITGQKDETWRRAVTEDSAHAWYKGGGPLHPWKGKTDPEPTEWDEEKKYSWVKAPRYNGQPAQVGPVANVLVGYAQGHPLMKKWTDAALEKISTIARVKATPAMLHSTLSSATSPPSSSRPTPPSKTSAPPSLDLPAYLAGYERVIFIDAVALDAPPGTIRVFSRDEITSVPTGIRVSPHEPTINDALIVLDFAGTAPREVVLVGVVPETLEGGLMLSPRVAGAVGRAGDAVLTEVARYAAAAVSAPPTVTPDARCIA